MADVTLGATIRGSRGIKSNHLDLGSGLHKNFAVSTYVLDLSGSAQTFVPVFYANTACKIQSIKLVYQEASGAGNCVVKLGHLTDDDYFYTGSTENSQAIGTVATLTPLQTVVAAGTLVTCANAGGSGAAGQVVFVVEYTIDDA